MNINELERFHEKKKTISSSCVYPQPHVTTDVPKWLAQSQPSTSCNQCLHWGEAWETGELRTCVKKERKTHIVYTCELFSKCYGTRFRQAGHDVHDTYQNFID